MRFRIRDAQNVNSLSKTMKSPEHGGRGGGGGGGDKEEGGGGVVCRPSMILWHDAKLRFWRRRRVYRRLRNRAVNWALCGLQRNGLWLLGF